MSQNIIHSAAEASNTTANPFGSEWQKQGYKRAHESMTDPVLAAIGKLVSDCVDSFEGHLEYGGIAFCEKKATFIAELDEVARNYEICPWEVCEVLKKQSVPFTRLQTTYRDDGSGDYSRATHYYTANVANKTVLFQIIVKSQEFVDDNYDAFMTIEASVHASKDEAMTRYREFLEKSATSYLDEAFKDVLRMMAEVVEPSPEFLAFLNQKVQELNEATAKKTAGGQ